MGYDIILFDADGTLFDFRKSEHISFKKTMNNFDLPFSEALYNDYHQINDNLWKDFERGLISKPDLLLERYKRYIKKHNLKADAAELNRFYFRALGSCSYLFDGAAEVCRHFALTKSLYLVTNGETTVQKSRYAGSEIKQYFKDLFVSESVGYPKPHIEYFDYVFSKIENFDRSSTVIIGDSLSGDILGGNNAGISTCWYNPDNLINETDVVCNYTIKSLSELYDIL